MPAPSGTHAYCCRIGGPSQRQAYGRAGHDGVSVRTLNRELGVSHNLIHYDTLDVLELRFLIFSAECPEVLCLMNMEGSRPTDRIEYIFDNYVWPLQSTVGMMLDQLADDGMIRRIPLRTFHFLVTDGAEPADRHSGRRCRSR